MADTTLNFTKIKTKCYAFSIGTSAVILIIFATLLKLGVNSSLLCGLRYTESRPYLEMLRNWEILLVPFLAKKCISLTEEIPSFMLIGSFSYY